jgi:hypothetical protein
MTATTMMKAYDPLYLEAERDLEPLFAMLYFSNGKRLQIVGAKGELATLNLSKADDYTDTFITLLYALRRDYGRILIRGEHLTHLPACFHPYFETMEGGDEP